MAPSSTLPQWFADATDSLRESNIAGWMSIYAQDAVHEFLFTPEGPQRFEGYDAIEAHVKSVFEGGVFKFGTLKNVRVHGDSDTETIIEAVGMHYRADGTPFELGYVFIITRRDGKVVLIREYFNPLQLAMN